MKTKIFWLLLISLINVLFLSCKTIQIEPIAFHKNCIIDMIYDGNSYYIEYDDPDVFDIDMGEYIKIDVTQKQFYDILNENNEYVIITQNWETFNIDKL